MPTITIKRKKAAPVARKVKTAKTGATRALPAAKPTVKKPDMKAWAARRLASLKEQYGERIIADSSPMLEEMRADHL
jgi:hypothetical protein